jgi:acetylornithine deacetylase
VQTGLIKGGRAINIVPAECEFDFEIRAVPGFNPQQVVSELQIYADAELIPKMRSVEADTGICMAPLSNYPGLATSPKSQAANLLALLSGSDEFGSVPYGSEGGLFERAGIPTVVCGPGSMDQGHKPNEFVSLEQMAECDAMLARLADYLRNGSSEPSLGEN